MNLDRLTQGDRVTGIAGALLAIDLLFLPWHNIDIGILSVSRTGLQSPNAFYGVLALLLVIAVLAVIATARLSDVALPQLPIPWSQAVFGAGVAVAVLLVLKLVVETDFLGFGAFLGVLLAGAFTYGTYMVRSGGFEPVTAATAGAAAATSPPTAPPSSMPPPQAPPPTMPPPSPPPTPAPSSQPPVSSAPTSAPSFCGSCGTALSADSAFCASCGRPVE